MLRATRVLPAGTWSVGTGNSGAADTVVLDYDGRHRRRMAMEGKGGLGFLLDLDVAVPLRDGDGLVLEDGRLVVVTAAPEPLAEIAAPSPEILLRLAWHLGNRHLPAELGGRIRIRRDHVIEQMIEGLGGSVTHIDAPFDPEGGAYHGGGHHHQPAHDHGHGHHHEHAEHHEHDDRIEVEGVERG